MIGIFILGAVVYWLLIWLDARRILRRWESEEGI